MSSSAQNSGSDGFRVNFVDDATLTDVNATENGGYGFDFSNTNNLLLCNGNANANTVNDVFIASTCTNTSVYESCGCIQPAKVIDNGVGTSLFFLQQKLDEILAAILAL